MLMLLVINFFSISILKLGLDDVRLISEECMEQNKRLKEELAEHNVSLEIANITFSSYRYLVSWVITVP